MITKFDPPLPGQLDNYTWMNFNPLLFLEDDNITVPNQKGRR